MRDSQQTYGASSLKPRSSSPPRDLNCRRPFARRRRRPPAVPRISGLRSTGRDSDPFCLQGRWPRCYQKCLRLSDANWLITPALITRSPRAKTKLPHWKSCGLGQTSCGGKPRSFVTRPFLLSARFATTWRSAPSQPRTCGGHWSNLYGSVHVLLWWTVSTRVYARAASRAWSAYRPLRSFVTSSTRSKLATSLAPKVFVLNFKPAKIKIGRAHV